MQKMRMRLDPNLLKKSAVFGLVSVELVAYIGGAFLVGTYIDGWLKSSPIFVVCCSCLGLALAVFKIMKLQKSQQDTKKENL